MSGVNFVLVYSDTTSIPSNSGPVTSNQGFNVPAGPCDELVFRITTSNSTGAVVADFGNIMSALRVVINGVQCFDFRSGYASASNNAPSQFNYFLNSLGMGRASEIPGDTAKEVLYRIPIGRNLPGDSVSRVEFQLEYSATAAAVASGALEVYIRYNTAMTNTTTVSNATSFTASGTTENLVVRLPAGVPGVVAGIMIQNDSASDQFDSVRLISQSDFSLPKGLLRSYNGDTMNGIMYADDGVSTTQQTYALTVAGGLFLPTFGLTTNDDIRLTLTSTASTTFTFTPVLVAPINASKESRGTQTQAVVTNVGDAVLAGSSENV